MSNTGAFQVNIATLNDGTSAVSATGDDTATTDFQHCAEAIVVVTCTAVASSGIFVPKLQGSTDGGSTYSDLTPTTGSAMSAVSATGVQKYRFLQVPPKLKTHWTKTSGTSVTAVVTIIGLGPHDTGSATAV